MPAVALGVYLQGRVSADPDDPDIQELRAQLELLGPLPSRRPLSHQQEMDMWNWAEQEVTARWVGGAKQPLPHARFRRAYACTVKQAPRQAGMSLHLLAQRQFAARPLDVMMPLTVNHTLRCALAAGWGLQAASSAAVPDGAPSRAARNVSTQPQRSVRQQ